ncbi:MAG: HNH endonuclease domain-containing protein [Verrucomicrobiota bacterium]
MDLDSLHYPEKTHYLGQVFSDTTNSYKLVWFLATLSLLERRRTDELTMADILSEMAIVAWHPVCLFRLSLGRQDKLQEVILDLQREHNLDATDEASAIRFVLGEPSTCKAKLAQFKRYVPTRFLTPWFAEELRPIPDARRGRQINHLAKNSQKSLISSPYWIDGESIRFNQSWLHFLTENMGVVRAFAEHHFARYLQTRNPNVPGVINKLHAPINRQLTDARKFWCSIRAQFNQRGQSRGFRDIYSDQPLGDRFTIDHFLPWSFVVHDLLWNLTPVEQSTNSAKSDRVPDLDTYLPRLANLHYEAIKTGKKNPKILEDYTDCFRISLEQLATLSSSQMEAKFCEVITPQAQIAMNQGFQSGWKLASRMIPLVISSDTNPNAGNPEIEILPMFEGRHLKSDCLPFYSLKVAASGFLAGDAPNPEGYVDVAKYGFTKRISPGMFVTQVVGKSMEPTIKDGAYCVFCKEVGGTNQRRILLVAKHDYTDPETGDNYTVKRYQSRKIANEDGWQHDSIELVPDNPDRKKFPILRFTQTDEENLRPIAEFVAVLKPAPNS